jgi:hypothetical protein
LEFKASNRIKSLSDRCNRFNCMHFRYQAAAAAAAEEKGGVL